MGGFGRCLEELFKVLVGIGRKDAFNFALVLKEVVSALQSTYPAISKEIESMREAFLAAVARRVINKRSTFGSASLDQVISAGLIRLEGCILQCPYVLYLLLATGEYPWNKLGFYLPVEAREDKVPWQDWETINCEFRVLKSIAFAREPSVSWKCVHCGARFGPDCDRYVKEVPRKFALHPKQMSTKSNGFTRDKCSCDLDSDNPVFLYQPGGSFLCLEGDPNGFFHEVHRCKYIEDSKPLSLEEFRMGSNDLFVLHCTGNVSAYIPDSMLRNCAIVDASCWEKYYGPFAARAFFVKNIPPPSLNTCSDVELALVDGVDQAYSEKISTKRMDGPFSSYQDAAERTDISLRTIK